MRMATGSATTRIPGPEIPARRAASRSTRVAIATGHAPLVRPARGHSAGEIGLDRSSSAIAATAIVAQLVDFPDEQRNADNTRGEVRKVDKQVDRQANAQVGG
jgi:hypothetical protein